MYTMSYTSFENIFLIWSAPAKIHSYNYTVTNYVWFVKETRARKFTYIVDCIQWRNFTFNCAILALNFAHHASWRGYCGLLLFFRGISSWWKINLLSTKRIRKKLTSYIQVNKVDTSRNKKEKKTTQKWFILRNNI